MCSYLRCYKMDIHRKGWPDCLNTYLHTLHACVQCVHVCAVGGFGVMVAVKVACIACMCALPVGAIRISG